MKRAFRYFKWLTRDTCPQPFGLAPGAVGVASRHDKQEFFPAIPADGVVRAHQGAHASGRFSEQRVTHQVSMCIVHSFEVIQIGQDDSYGDSFALRPGELALESIQNGPTVPQTGQGIVRGLEAQGFARGNQLFLQIEDAFAHAQASFEFQCVKGLGQIIVGTGLETFDDVSLLAFGGEQEKINITLARAQAGLAAHLEAIYAGHDPVQDGQTWRIFLLELLPGLRAIPSHHHLVAPLEKQRLKQVAGDTLVIGDQDFHRASS